MSLKITPLKREHIPLIINYWHNSTPDHLIGMGVDLNKIPKVENFEKFLNQQIDLPNSEKQSLALIWYYNDQPIGHCNVNDIKINDSAFMHLHIWTKTDRQKGIGFQLLQLSIDYFFETLNLKVLYSQPYSRNKAPNKVLDKLGFSFIKTYKTVPGSINFEQDVNLWELKR